MLRRVVFASHTHTSMLAAGWDSHGELLVERTVKDLSTTPIDLLHYAQGQMDHRIRPVYVHASDIFWRTLNHSGTWEGHTLFEFQRRIHERTTYVGFGTWIGPTMLFAAQLALRAFVLQANGQLCGGEALALFASGAGARRSKKRLNLE